MLDGDDRAALAGRQVRAATLIRPRHPLPHGAHTHEKTVRVRMSKMY